MTPRVLVLGLTWPPETFIGRLLAGLTERGVGVTVAVGARPAGARPAVVDPALARIDWLVLPGRGGSLADRMRRRIGPARGDNLPLERFDVLYFPWNTAAIAYAPLLARKPAVISCRGAQINVAPHNPERAAIRDGLAATFARAAAVHCVSAAIRDEAASYGLDASKTVVIRPAVDPDVFRPGAAPASPRAGGPLRIVTTGSVIWRKGYEYALLAMRRLIDQGVAAHFDIVGGGPEAQRLLYTIHDLGLQDHVTWHGAQPPGEVLRRLQAADVFLLTSLSEGIANAALEGMACGLPVVTSAVGGMGEAVSDGVEGFLTPARDPEAAAAALARLAASPGVRRDMGAAARRRVERDFRLSDQVGAFADLFRAVAA